MHLPLIMGKNEDGSVSKLSKRHGSTSFQGLLEDGYLAPVITNYIALLGWCPKDNQEIFSLKELEEAFSIDGISKSPAVFDYDKLLWFNGEYIRKMSGEEFRTAAMPYYKEIFGDAEKPYNVLDAILQPRILKFKEIPSLLGFFKELPEYSADLFINKKSKATLENAPVMLRAAIETLSAIENWQVDTIHDALIALAQSLEVKNGHSAVAGTHRGGRPDRYPRRRYGNSRRARQRGGAAPFTARPSKDRERIKQEEKPDIRKGMDKL